MASCSVKEGKGERREEEIIGFIRDLNSEDRETNLKDPDTLWSDLCCVTVYYIEIKERMQGVRGKLPKNSIKR